MSEDISSKNTYSEEQRDDNTAIVEMHKKKKHMKDINEAYLVKVTHNRLTGGGRELKRYFRIDETILYYSNGPNNTDKDKAFDLMNIVDVRNPSTLYPSKPSYEGSCIDIVFGERTLSLAAMERFEGSSILLKKILSFADLKSHFKARPDNDDDLNVMFQQYMDDIMMKEERRHVLWDYNSDRKWFFIDEYQKSLSKNNFALLDTIDYLSYDELLPYEAREINSTLSSSNHLLMEIFIDRNGIELLFGMLKKYCLKKRINESDQEVVSALLNALHCLLNAEYTEEAVKKYADAVPCLLLCYTIDNDGIVESTKQNLIYMLRNIHDEELIAKWLNRFSEIKKEKYRMESIIEALKSSNKPNVVCNIVFFINYMINQVTSLFKRISIRNLFTEWDYVEVLDALVEKARDDMWENRDILNEESSIFVEGLNKDTAEATVEGVNFTDPNDLFKKIMENAQTHHQTDSLVKIFRNFFNIPTDEYRGARMWEIMMQLSDFILKITPGSYASSFDENISEVSRSLIEMVNGPTSTLNLERIDPNYVRFLRLRVLGESIDKLKQQVADNNLDPSYMDKEFPDYRLIPQYAAFFDERRRGVNVDVLKQRMIEKNLDENVLDVYEDNESQKTRLDYTQYIDFFRRRETEDITILRKEMEQDGLDSTVLDKDTKNIEFVDIPFSQLIKRPETVYVQTSGIATPVVSASCQHNYSVHADFKYYKFFKLLKMGRPKEGLQMKMQQEGLDPAILDNDMSIVGFDNIPDDTEVTYPDGHIEPCCKASPASAPVVSASCQHTYSVHADFKYYKFFKLLKMGRPKEGLQMKMQQEGLDPSILDNDMSIVGFDNIPDDTEVTYPDGHIEPCCKASSAPAPVAVSTVRPLATSRPAVHKAPEPIVEKMEPRLKYKPSKKLRPLYWNVITLKSSIENSIWKSMECKNLKVDTKMIENEFANDAAPAPIAMAPTASSSDKVVNLLDAKREQNVGISLKKLKLKGSVIHHALLFADWSVLRKEIIQQLSLMVPTLEEQDICNNYSGDIDKLSEVSRFAYELSDIPGVSGRIACCSLYLTFDDEEERLKEALDVYKECLEILKTNEGIKQLLEIILMIGNYLNGESNRGGAWGFRIDVLDKLDRTKTSDNKKTLLTVLCEIIESNYKNVLESIKKLSALERANKLLYADILKNVNDLRSGIANMVRVSNTKPFCDEDRFPQVMSIQSNKLKGQLQSIVDSQSLVNQYYDSVVALYGENKQDYTVNQFFDVFLSFYKSFMIEYDKLIKGRLMEEDMKKKQKAREQMETICRSTAPKRGGIDKFKEIIDGKTSREVTRVARRESILRDHRLRSSLLPIMNTPMTKGQKEKVLQSKLGLTRSSFNSQSDHRLSDVKSLGSNTDDSDDSDDFDDLLSKK